MPLEITESIIGAFFNGCKVHGRRDLSKKLAEDIMRKDLKRPGALVTPSNIHAAHEAWEQVENVRKVMEKKIHKIYGFSLDELVGVKSEKEGNRLDFRQRVSVL